MAKRQAEKIHDRRSADLPINSAVAIAIVSDPYSQNGESIQVVRSIRDDPLAGMLSRQQIDQAQYEAGRLWQKYYEDSEIGSIQAIDPTKEKVDGGKMKDPMTIRQLAAFKKIAEAVEAIGKPAAVLLREILGERITIYEAAQRRQAISIRQINRTGQEFRGALEKLARCWQLAG